MGSDLWSGRVNLVDLTQSMCHDPVVDPTINGGEVLRAIQRVIEAPVFGLKIVAFSGIFLSATILSASSLPGWKIASDAAVQSTPSADHGGTVDEVSSATLAEAEAYAEHNGVSLDVAVRNIQMEKEISSWVKLAKENIPDDRLSGISVDLESKSDVPMVRVRLTPGPEISQFSQVAEVASGFSVQVEEGLLSLRQKAATIDDEIVLWKERIPSLQGVYADESTDSIVLMLDDSTLPVREGSRFGGDRAAEVLAERFGIDLWNLDPDLSIEIEKAAPGSSDANRGGRDLRTCTEGFVVMSAAGNKRFLTAAHCGTDQPWRFFGQTANKATVRMGTRHNTFADLAWFRVAGRS